MALNPAGGTLINGIVLAMFLTNEELRTWAINNRTNKAPPPA
jgi:hypothetical protein